MIQNTVYEGIEHQERVRMLKEIADTLIVRTSEERRDGTLFVIVDLINRVGPSNVSLSTKDRYCYARLNLLAGEKAIATPDFSSALEFTENGISFLEDGHWDHDYDLSLALFIDAAGVACSLGKSHQMMNRLNEVSVHSEAEVCVVSSNEESHLWYCSCRFLRMQEAMETH
jgi:predicted ATPase